MTPIEEFHAAIRRIPNHLLRHYPGPLAGKKYRELELTCIRLGIRPTWADIENERARRRALTRKA